MARTGPVMSDVFCVSIYVRCFECHMWVSSGSLCVTNPRAAVIHKDSSVLLAQSAGWDKDTLLCSKGSLTVISREKFWESDIFNYLS